MVARERKTDFSPSPSHKNCRYCTHVKSCPWFQQQDEYLAAHPDDAKNLLNRLVVIKKEENLIKHALDEFGEEVYSDGGEKYGYTEYDSVNVDPKIFFAVCSKAGIDPSGYVSISKTNIEKLQSRLEDEDLIDLLSEGIQVTKKTRKVTPR